MQINSSQIIKFLILSSCVPCLTAQIVPPIEWVREIGMGIRKVGYSLYNLMNNCEYPDLYEWMLFMENYLECKEDAYKEVSLEEAPSISQHDLIESNCNAWNKAHKCNAQLAQMLDKCYTTKLGKPSRVGTDALRFSNAVTQFKCHHKNQYISTLNTDSVSITRADKLSLKCFEDRADSIARCVKKRIKTDSSNDQCRNMDLVHRCFHFHFETCEHQDTKAFVHTMLKQMSTDLGCNLNIYFKMLQSRRG